MKIIKITATVILLLIVVLGGILFYVTRELPHYLICSDKGTNELIEPTVICPAETFTYSNQHNVRYKGQLCTITNIPSCKNGTYLAQKYPIYGFLEKYQRHIFFLFILLAIIFHVWDQKRKGKNIVPKLPKEL